jgi:hypothetical protein
MINPQIYELTATATDDKGTRSESHEVDLELLHNEPGGPTPFIIITPPRDGSVALLGTPVVVASQVVSTDNNIRPVEIFDGTNLLGSIPDPSYSLTVSNLTWATIFWRAGQPTYPERSLWITQWFDHYRVEVDAASRWLGWPIPIQYSGRPPDTMVGCKLLQTFGTWQRSISTDSNRISFDLPTPTRRIIRSAFTDSPSRIRPSRLIGNPKKIS